jgi:hypothetical protein
VPLERVTDGGYLNALLCLVDGGEVEVSIDVEKGNLSLERLFELIQIDLDDGEGVLNDKVERLSSCDLVELNDLTVGRLDDCNDVWGYGYFLLTHELDWIRR